MKWQTAIHGRAWSSPIVVGPRVWLTTATPDGKTLGVVAVDRESGEIVQDTTLFEVASPQFAHSFNTYASPTPVADGGRVYVTFGSPGTAALDAKTGAVLWTRRDFECNHFRGAGSSPIVFRDRLIMHFDGSDHQFVVALDTKTGKTLWRTERSIEFKDLKPDGTIEAEGDMRKAFATPHVIEVGGAPVIISTGSKATYGYDPMTGKELWRVEDRSAHSGSTRPVVGHGLVFIPTGFPKGGLIAIRPDGRGDVTATHVAWRLDRGIPNKPSLALAGNLLFMVTDAGVAQAVEAATRQSGVDVAHRRHVLGVAARLGQPRLLLQRGRQDDGDRGRAGVQGAGRESARRRLHGLARGGRRRPLPALAHAPLPDRVTTVLQARASS